MVATVTPNPPPADSPIPQIENPKSKTESALIRDLADPTQTLADVAYLHDLSLEQLTLWIARPDTTARLQALTDSIYLRTRLAAINHLATTVNALNIMIGAYIDEERQIPVNPTSIQDREQRRRARETARKAITLLTRLAHLPSPKKNTKTKPKTTTKTSPKRKRGFQHPNPPLPQNHLPPPPSSPPPPANDHHSQLTPATSSRVPASPRRAWP